MKADTSAHACLSLHKTEKERLWAQKQADIRAEMAAYAAEVAGTVDDLDPELEAMGLELLWDTE